MTWSARAPSLQATAGEPGGNSALAQRSGRRLGGSASSKRIERACRAADDLSRTFLGGGARSRPRPHLERARTRAHSGGRRRGLREPRGHSAKASGTGGGWAGAPARGAASAPAAQLQLSASPTIPSANPTWARPHPQPRQRRHTSRRGARFVSIMNTHGVLQASYGGVWPDNHVLFFVLFYQDEGAARHHARPDGRARFNQRDFYYDRRV